MKSDIEIKSEIFDLIKGSELEKSITGKLSKRIRPKNSTKEDIVISILANEGDELQSSFVNVNIYVADDDIEGQFEECTIRLKELCRLSIDFFKSDTFSKKSIYLDSQRVLEVTATHEHVINNKLLYRRCNE